MLPIFTIDLPPQQPAIRVAAASEAKRASSPVKTFRYCKLVESSFPDSGANMFGVVGPNAAKFFGFMHKKFTVAEVALYRSEVVVQAKHGVVERVGPPEDNAWMYKARDNYIGKDEATLVVEANGRQLKIIMGFDVVDSVPGGDDKEDVPPELPVCDEKSSGHPVSLKVAQLDGAVVEHGTAVDSTITFNDNAAGHGEMDLVPVGVVLARY